MKKEGKKYNRREIGEDKIERERERTKMEEL